MDPWDQTIYHTYSQGLLIAIDLQLIMDPKDYSTLIDEITCHGWGPFAMVSGDHLPRTQEEIFTLEQFAMDQCTSCHGSTGMLTIYLCS